MGNSVSSARGQDLIFCMQDGSASILRANFRKWILKSVYFTSAKVVSWGQTSKTFNNQCLIILLLAIQAMQQMWPASHILDFRIGLTHLIVLEYWQHKERKREKKHLLVCYDYKIKGIHSSRSTENVWTGYVVVIDAHHLLSWHKHLLNKYFNMN